ADPNNLFSHADSTVSPAKSSMQDSAGNAAPTTGDGPVSLRPAGPYPRMVAATAIPTATSVITVSTPLATDLSARNSVTKTMIPKNPAAANVSHIGKAGVRQTWSSDVA